MTYNAQANNTQQATASKLCFKNENMSYHCGERKEEKLLMT
jgi:hypothetical protein